MTKNITLPALAIQKDKNAAKNTTKETAKNAPAIVTASDQQDANTDFVTVELPEGTRAHTTPSGKEWLITPLHNGRERWFDLKKDAARGWIKGAPTKGKNGRYSLTILRSKLSYRHLSPTGETAN